MLHLIYNISFKTKFWSPTLAVSSWTLLETYEKFSSFSPSTVHYQCQKVLKLTFNNEHFLNYTMLKLILNPQNWTSFLSTASTFYPKLIKFKDHFSSAPFCFLKDKHFENISNTDFLFFFLNICIQVKADLLSSWKITCFFKICWQCQTHL